MTKPARVAEAIALGGSLGIPLTEIGRMREAAGVRVEDESGSEIVLAKGGYRHF